MSTIYSGICIDGPWQGRNVQAEYKVICVVMTDQLSLALQRADPTAAINIRYGHYSLNEHVWQWEPPL